MLDIFSGFFEKLFKEKVKKNSVQHIRMISEGSCDTEESNDAENTALLYRNTLYFKIY